jgi:hypothetical protein
LKERFKEKKQHTDSDVRSYRYIAVMLCIIVDYMITMKLEILNKIIDW